MVPESKTHPALALLFDQTERPIYMIDANRRVVWCNRALSEWLQLDPERILGRYVEYHSEPDESDPDPFVQRKPATWGSSAPPLTSLCPPPDALYGKECIGTLSTMDRKGRLLHRRGQFIPLDGPGTASSNGDDPAALRNVLAILDARDLTSAELATNISSTSMADDLHRLIRQFRRDSRQRFISEALLGESLAMQTVRSQVAAAAKSAANVLVVGRPGSGRTRIAKTIHYLGAEDEHAVLISLEGPLVTLESLRRSFDRLDQARPSTPGHSLLICDVATLNDELQSLLYEAINRRQGRIRLMATMDHLATLAADFDEDPTEGEDTMPAGTLQPPLLAALSTITITVPRLVDRPEDLPLLAQFFLEAANKGQARQVGGIRSAALDRLALYSWPGEVEELRQVMEQAHRACTSAEIDVSDLPVVIHHAVQAASRASRPRETIVLDEFLARVERELIERALREAAGNKAEAARLLGTTRAKLYRRLVQLGLEGTE